MSIRDDIKTFTRSTQYEVLFSGETIVFFIPNKWGADVTVRTFKNPCHAHAWIADHAINQRRVAHSKALLDGKNPGPWYVYLAEILPHGGYAEP